MMQLVKLWQAARRRKAFRGESMSDNPANADRPEAVPSLPAPPGYATNAVHLVRTAQQINLSLSQMADQKASILMGATFLVFTLAVGQARGGGLPWSLGILALFAFVSAMCAVFAVLPSVRAPKGEGLDQGQVNKLFFGHFTRIDEEAWTDAVLAELRCDETMYRMMLHDIYQNGQVLQRKKYRFLGYAYRSFMLGLCLTVVVFAAELALR